MTGDLKSFKKDWQRWSLGERAMAIVLLLAVSMALMGPLLGGPFAGGVL